MGKWRGSTIAGYLRSPYDSVYTANFRMVKPTFNKLVSLLKSGGFGSNAEPIIKVAGKRVTITPLSVSTAKPAPLDATLTVAISARKFLLLCSWAWFVEGVCIVGDSISATCLPHTRTASLLEVCRVRRRWLR